MDGGAGGGVDEEGGFAAGFACGDGAVEFGWDHLAGGVDGDGDDVFAAEPEEVGCFFDRVVTVGGGKEGEFAAAIAVSLGLGVERVAGDDNGCAVCCAAAGLRDAARGGLGKVEERGEVLGCAFFDQSQGWGDLVDVDLFTQ